MKKISIPLLCIFLTLLFSIQVQAMESKVSIYEGYTSEGIYYEVYDIETNVAQERAAGDTIDVIREIRFNGIVTPPSTQTWQESISGTYYTGTLKLYRCSYENNTTIAYYRGTLTAIN